MTESTDVLANVSASDVLAWARALPPDESLGACGAASHCIVANYAAKVLGKRVSVVPHSRWLEIGGYYHYYRYPGALLGRRHPLNASLSLLGNVFDHLPGPCAYPADIPDIEAEMKRLEAGA